jgi:hypothetical protein
MSSTNLSSRSSHAPARHGMSFPKLSRHQVLARLVNGVTSKAASVSSSLTFGFDSGDRGVIKLVKEKVESLTASTFRYGGDHVRTSSTR